MTATAHDPRLVRRTVDERKVKKIGSVGGLDYIEHDGAEYAIDQHPSDPGAFADPELIVNRTVSERLSDGSRFEHSAAYRGRRVPAGTYARRTAAVADRKARARQRAVARPLDLIAASPLMQDREPVRFVPAPADKSPLLGPLRSMLGKAPPVIEAGGYQAPKHSAAGIVSYLRGRGVQLSLARNGGLLLKSASRLDPATRQLVLDAEPLLIASLGGPVAHCAECDAPAITIVFPRLALCATHAAGD